MYDVAILGGGWAGLLAAREINRTSPETSIVVLEKDPRDKAGGLLRSETIDGFTFDCGGPHILFSKFPETLAEVREILGTNVVELPRRNYVSFDNQLIPYPFENGIYLLPPDTRARIGTGLIEAALERARNPNWKPANFREWQYGVFGAAMAAEYLEPYNSKIWKRPLDQISADWVFTPGRLPVPEIPEIARAIAGIESVGYREQARFLYPRKGGILSLYESLLGIVEHLPVDVRFEVPVSAVNREASGWMVNQSVRSRIIVNTLPLPRVIQMVSDVPDSLKRQAHFDYNRVVVVGVALDQPGPDQTAVYVPRPDIPFHRYTWMSYLNPPSATGSNLIAEVTVPKDAEFDASAIATFVLGGLETLGVIADSSAVRFTRTWVNEYGYPVYSIGGSEAKRLLLREFNRHGLFSVGRWGSWEYWNTDMVLRAVKSTVADMTAYGVFHCD